MVRRRSARWVALAALVGAVAVSGANLAVSEYGTTILPTWLGLVGMLPCLPGVVAVVALWRHGRG